MTTEYSLGDYSFDLERFFPTAIFEKITDIRVDAPEIIEQQAQARTRRPRLTKDGKLAILAADHPARGVTALGGDPFRMGNRQQYLGRIMRVLIASEFDGFMSTPDMIEDLFILDYLVQQGGGPSFLDEKVLTGCMQRGGAAGVVGEIDDRFGSYSAKSMARFRLDGGKMMFRFVPDDERTLWTIDYCAQAVTDLNHYNLVPFVEPLRMDYIDGKWVSKNNADELVTLVGIVAGLGDSSRNTWMKLPYCQDFGRVTQATTMPILMLGGPSGDNPLQTYQNFSAGMTTSGNVRGALVGRNITFPVRDDPAAVARAIHGIVHDGLTAEDAVQVTMTHRDEKMDFLTEYIL
ncbi:MAG: deoxyribose-phosphate aldolase [Chloroflexota bacterium]|nr:deoxyribose-phosphate aldolase [Chloroflexota bacterium]